MNKNIFILLLYVFAFALSVLGGFMFVYKIILIMR